MEKIKSLFVLFSLSIVSIVFSACEKGQTLLDPVQSTEVESSLRSMDTRAANSSYAISGDILAHFRHYCQRDAGHSKRGYPNAEGAISDADAGAACCPTSYMMVSACLAQYKGYLPEVFAVSGARLGRIISGEPEYRYLSKMADYCSSKDRNFLSVETKFKESDRGTIKNFLESSLSRNRFVIVNVNAHTYQIKTVNDSRLFENSSRNPDLGYSPLYITSKPEENNSNIGGHVIVLIAINTDATGDGIVTYLDPLAKTRNGSNRRYVKYSLLLDSMAESGTTLIDGRNRVNYYDAFSIGLN